MPASAPFVSKELLEAQIKLIGFKVKPTSGNRIVVLCAQSDRIQVLTDLSRAFGAQIWPSTSSSIGVIKKDGYQIFVKPANRQGGLNSGLANEKMLYDEIQLCFPKSNSFIKVQFSTKISNKIFLIDWTKKCTHVGRDTKDRKKADIILSSNGVDVPFSIKQKDAEIWESADSYWTTNAVRIAKELEDQKKITLTYNKAKDAYKVSPQFAVEATDQEANEVIFGSDLQRQNGAVIIATFKKSDFHWHRPSNTLNIEVDEIIKNLQDVPKELYPWFLVRNDSTRNTKDGIKGIRCLAVSQSRISSTVLKYV